MSFPQFWHQFYSYVIGQNVSIFYVPLKHSHLVYQVCIKPLNSFSLKKVLIQSKNSFFRGQKQQEKKLDQESTVSQGPEALKFLQFPECFIYRVIHSCQEIFGLSLYPQIAVGSSYCDPSQVIYPSDQQFFIFKYRID